MVYSSYPPCNGVQIVLPILMMEDAAYSQDRGQGGVGRILHRKEERRHTIEHVAYSPSSSCT